MRQQVKRLGVPAVLLLFVLRSSGTAFAWQQTATTTSRQVTFEVVSVNGNVIVVKNADGMKEVTLPEDFRFTIDGRPVPMKEIRPGMKGVATIAETTTVRPVFASEVKSAVVFRALGNSVVLKDATGLRAYTQEQVDTRGIRLMKEGREVDLRDLREGDTVSGTIVSARPPEIVTEQQIQAVIEAASNTAKTGANTAATAGTCAATTAATATRDAADSAARAAEAVGTSAVSAANTAASATTASGAAPTAATEGVANAAAFSSWTVVSILGVAAVAGLLAVYVVRSRQSV